MSPPFIKTGENLLFCSRMNFSQIPPTLCTSNERRTLTSSVGYSPCGVVVLNTSHQTLTTR